MKARLSAMRMSKPLFSALIKLNGTFLLMNHPAAASSMSFVRSLLSLVS